MDYMLEPPRDLVECADCGSLTDGRYTRPDYSPGYHPGNKGPVVCRSCHELYDPRL